MVGPSVDGAGETAADDGTGERSPVGKCAGDGPSSLVDGDAGAHLPRLGSPRRGDPPRRLWLEPNDLDMGGGRRVAAAAEDPRE
jgi:hypothetical protein